MPKLRGTPPIRKPGCSPASPRIQANIEEFLVLPWVPATASPHLPESTFSASHCGPDTYRPPLSSIASTSGLPRENVLSGKWVLAVAGTHGKTSTSSMLAWILEDAGLQP